MDNRNLKILLCLILLLIICISSYFYQTATVQVSLNAATRKLQSSAVGMCVIDAESGRILLHSNEKSQLPMASTTKIMTALIAIEKTKNLDEVFKVDNRAIGIEGTSIYLVEDEELSMRDLLYGLMLASGNDAAMAIAYKIGNGKIDDFVELMNDKVKQLNLKNTHFDNPHGLDSATHYTSAYDLAIVAAKAMENETFREIVKTPIKQLPSKTGSRFVRNKHKLLGVYDGCEGIKTGFTDNALRCCVTSINKNGFRIICVVLNCQNMFEETIRLADLTYSEYKKQEIYLENNIVGKASVENGVKDVVKLYSLNGFSYPLLENELENVKIEINYTDNVVAPIKKNTIVGEVKIYLENNLIFSEKIYTMEEVQEKTVSDKLKDIVNNWY